MRYDSLRKRIRDSQLIQFRKDNPGLSQKEIGQAFNITGARVSQILKRDGVK